MHRASALFGLALLAACSQAPAPAPSAPPGESPSPVPQGAPTRGEVRNTDGLRFRICGTSAAPLLLTGTTAEMSPPAGGGLYVEVRGTTDRSGFRVDELVRARPLGEGASCSEPVFDGDFVMSGNEPFWAIEIRRDGIVYRSPEEPKGRKYPYAATRSAGELFYATRLEGEPGSILEIDITPRRCVDSMSGEIRSYQARVILDGRELNGCAAAGVPFGEFGDAPLHELERFAGTHATVGPVWAAEPMQTRLKALLGNRLGAFASRFQVAGPLRLERGIFYATGNMQHQGGTDVAAFLADPESDTINVVIVENRKREDFKEGGRDVPKPAEVTTFLQNLE